MHGHLNTQAYEIQYNKKSLNTPLSASKPLLAIKAGI